MNIKTNIRTTTALTVACSAVLGYGLKPATKPTMDNYSFAVGVWCAHRVMDTNVPSQKWSDDQKKMLWEARHLSQTNGWPAFNERSGFQGDE